MSPSTPSASSVGDEAGTRRTDRPARRRTFTRVALSGAVLLTFGLLFWWVSRAHKKAAPHPPVVPITVATATARRADVAVHLEAIGTVTPVHTALISSQVSGQIVGVHYKEGQLVRQGTPLIEIDSRSLRATLLQAEGVLQRDLQVLAQAKMDLARYRAAWSRNAIAKQQLDDQEKLVAQTEGTVKNDRGTVAFDRVQLSYCFIASPITGRVGLRLVDPGNIVTAGGGTTLAIITQLQPISVVFTISEDDLSAVHEQLRRGARLAVDALDRVKAKTLAKGTLLTIDNQIDTTTGTVKLRALFDNADEALFPNQFVNARLRVRTIDGATVLPSSAVQRDGTQAFVYVVAGGHAHIRNVETGVVEGTLTQVSNLAPGTVVANGSFDKLQDGAAVTMSGPSPPPAHGGRSASR
jgi:multidrug efflux system membrane fusion protein